MAPNPQAGDTTSDTSTGNNGGDQTRSQGGGDGGGGSTVSTVTVTLAGISVPQTIGTITTTNQQGGPLTVYTVQVPTTDADVAPTSGRAVTTTPVAGSGQASTVSLVNSNNAAVPSTVASSSGTPTSPNGTPGAVSSTTGTPTESPNDNTPFSTGQLAGGVVGALLGAALLTFLATWFFLGRRRKQRPSSSRYDHDGGDKGGAIALAEKPSSRSDRDVPAWLAYLPQSADDRTMQQKVKQLFDQVELHVDNYYRKTNVEMDKETSQALTRIDSGKLPVPITDLIRNQRMAPSVIKHCIANLLVTRITPSKDPNRSLLPSWLAVQPAKLTSSNTQKEDLALQQAHSQWKSLNAWLYGRADADPSYVQQLEFVADDIGELLAAAFFPWQVSPEDSGAMQQHERNMVNEAGNIGTFIMSQPSGYEFRWSADSGGSTSTRSMIMIPGFWKVSDEKGRPLDQPQLIASPFIVRV